MPPEFICNVWKVEHGSAAFTKTPNSKYVVFDAGRSDDFSPAEYLNTQWGVDEIEKLVISHPHDDHIRDLPNVYSLLDPSSRVRNPDTPERLIYPSGKSNLKEPMKTWLEMSNNFTGSVDKEKRFDNAEHFGGVQFNTYYAKENQIAVSARDNINNYSLLTTIRYRGLLIIFPGDLEPEGWEAVLNNTTLSSNLDGKFKMFVASHHGRRSGIRWSDGSLYRRILDLVEPNLVIISDKRGNESTDSEAYRPFCSGFGVYKDGVTEDKKILNTKTNNCVSIQIIENKLYVVV